MLPTVSVIYYNIMFIVLFRFPLISVCIGPFAQFNTQRIEKEGIELMNCSIRSFPLHNLIYSFYVHYISTSSPTLHLVFIYTLWAIMFCPIISQSWLSVHFMGVLDY